MEKKPADPESDDWTEVLVGRVVKVDSFDDLLILTYLDGRRVLIRGDGLQVGEENVPTC